MQIQQYTYNDAKGLVIALHTLKHSLAMLGTVQASSETAQADKAMFQYSLVKFIKLLTAETNTPEFTQAKAEVSRDVICAGLSLIESQLPVIAERERIERENDYNIKVNNEAQRIASKTKRTNAEQRLHEVENQLRNAKRKLREAGIE